jgi:hypothetical protein
MRGGSIEKAILRQPPIFESVPKFSINESRERFKATKQNNIIHHKILQADRRPSFSALILIILSHTHCTLFASKAVMHPSDSQEGANQKIIVSSDPKPESTSLCP